MKAWYLILLLLSLGCTNRTVNDNMRESMALCVANCQSVGKVFSDATADSSGYLRNCMCKSKDEDKCNCSSDKSCCSKTECKMK